MRGRVFCDYLDCTFSPEDNPVRDVENLIQTVGAHCDRPPFGSKAKLVWVLESGRIVVQENNRWVRISASGNALDVLRRFGLLDAYVCALNGSPCRVTRVDLALDVFTDAAPIVKRLHRKYPDTCQLSRKAVKTSVLLSSRFDGVQSGTFYVGDRRKSEVTAACYDKQKEAFDKRGEEIPPTMRYEIRCKAGVNPSLRDVLDPEPLFWNYAGGALLPKPAGVRDWVPGRGLEPWLNSWVPAEPATTMKHRIDDSPELEAIARLAVLCGSEGPKMGERLLLEAFRKHVHIAERSLSRSKPFSDAHGIQPEPKGE